MTNQEQARYWNGGEAVHWLVHEERYECMLAPFTGHLLTAAAIGRAGRVAGIGCGTGSTTRTAGRAAIEGEALGVDLSAAMLRQAARRGQQEGLANVRFGHGDAQVHRFIPGVGDVAVSRFGVMFFAGPAAAFASIARGLRPGGRLVFVCWQTGPPAAARAGEAVQAALEPCLTPDGLLLGSRAWLVTASRPWQ